MPSDDKGSFLMEPWTMRRGRIDLFFAVACCVVATAAVGSPKIPAPREHTVSPLPQLQRPARYSVDILGGGGLRITIGDAIYLVESSYSYPGGGENRLVATDIPDGKGEFAWSVKPSGAGSMIHEVSAHGKHYSIDRFVEVTPTHVLIKDKITNLTDDVVGIILSNTILAQSKDGGKVADIPNRTCFVHGARQGIGMVPLDDVYRYQCERFAGSGTAGLRTDKFGLDKKVSYTVEWAVYPTASGDYYDFLNVVRSEEGLNITRVDGSFSFAPRDKLLTREFVENRGLAYVSLPCLANVIDVPGLDIEGFEFLDMPKERERLRKNFRQYREEFPHLKTMFHIAHPLYATDKPDEKFPDSRIIGSDGRQTAYGGRDNTKYYSKYFEPEQVKQGYRWFAFYPTMKNSFGKAMLEGVDMMLGDEIGCTGMFADGYTHSYGGWYTYDRWDGHTVEIDPKTKTVKRKMGAVNLLAQDALIETIRRVNATGGVLIANSYVGTRTICKEPFIYCLETSRDSIVAHLYLAPTIIGLGDPHRINNELDLYNDIRDKLKWGALYFYYGEKEVTHKTVTSEMFPITAQHWRRGYVKGLERLITIHSGVYGWRDHRNLHFAYLYDKEGKPAPCGFLTTVDDGGVRTEIKLGENETAVLKHLPVTLHGGAPINLVAVQYDRRVIHLALNGQGKARLEVRSGDFAVAPGHAYVVHAGSEQRITAGVGGVLTTSISLDGQTDCRIELAK